MPTFDYARASFVQSEFRYKIAEDVTIKSKFPDAQEIVIDTQLSETDAAALVTTYFAELSKTAIVFTVEIDGVMKPEDLKTAIPSYTASFTQYLTDSRTFKLTRFETDFLAQKTTLVIRG
jgi:hypothetical protein